MDEKTDCIVNYQGKKFFRSMQLKYTDPDSAVLYWCRSRERKNSGITLDLLMQLRTEPGPQNLTICLFHQMALYIVKYLMVYK